MNIKIKQRLVGGVVVIAVVAIVLPLFFHRDVLHLSRETLTDRIPAKPELATYTSADTHHIQFSFQSADGTNDAKSATEPEVAAMINPIAQQKAMSTQTKTRVNVKPALSLAAPPEAWVVQLTTLSSKDNADKLITALMQAGYDAYDRTYTHDNKTLFRIMVGPEIRKEKAEQLQQQLAKQFKLQGVVVHYEVG